MTKRSGDSVPSGTMPGNRYAATEVSARADLDALFEIEARVMATSPHVLDTGGPEGLLGFLSRGGTPITYIWTERRVGPVGYLALLDDASEAMEIRSIAVVPESQSSGIGAAMLRHARRIAVQRGKCRLVLATSPHNHGAVRFYQRHGFVLERTEADYYGDGTPRCILSTPLQGA